MSAEALRELRRQLAALQQGYALIQGKYYGAILADLEDKRECMRSFLDIEALSGIAENAAMAARSAATLSGDPMLIDAATAAAEASTNVRELASQSTADASKRQRTGVSRRLADN